MKSFPVRLPLLVVGAMAAVLSASPSGAAGPEEDFELLAAALQRFHELKVLQGGSDRPVTFNAAAARAYGFSAQAIKLGQEIADATNDIVHQQKKAGRTGRDDPIVLDTRGQPELDRFLGEATKRAKARAAASDPGTETAPEKEAVPGIAHLVCGYYPNPKPSRAGPWRSYTSSSPAATLRRLGYHATPGILGGGWTRAQTYQWLICGFRNYRDHALITGRTSFREQNYKGSPGGEPNPEFGAPWPYPDWPVYVIWWHRTF
jgi:hypothetical protein